MLGMGNMQKEGRKERVEMKLSKVVESEAWFMNFNMTLLVCGFYLLASLNHK